MAELNAIQENQAARIRWLLSQVTAEVPHGDIIMGFLQYVDDHPFPAEVVITEPDDDDEPEPGGATSAWDHHRGI